VREHEHQDLRISLGAYVLGQLPAAEAAVLEAHLDTCPECTAELVELTPVAGALSRQRAHPTPDESPAPPPGLGDRVVEAVSRTAQHETRRTWIRAGSAAAAAAVVAVVSTVAVQSLNDNDPRPGVPLEAVQVRTDGPGLVASADLVNHTWGVEVKLHAEGFDRGGRYRVAVLGTDGRRYPAGEFVGTGAKKMDCNLNSSVLRERASGFEVRDARGEVVVTSAFG
jgi:hypothetical protein